MKFKLIFSLILITSIFACNKEPEAIINNTVDTPTTVVNQTGEMSGLVVPDGFDYSVSKPVVFDLTMIDSTGQEVNNVAVDIFGIYNGENAGKLFSGLTKNQGKFEVQLDIPNHYTNLVIRTNQGGDVRNHNFDVQSTISTQIKINGTNFTSSDERGLNCYPDITGIFSADNKLVGISSSEPILNLEVTYSDGSTEIINNVTGEISFSNVTPEICNDGIDNDGDGLIDCADPQCGSDYNNCSGSIACTSSFYQIVGKSLKLLNPTTGDYTHAGDLPNSFDTYNGSGYNREDGFIYCTGKINSTGKIYLVRMYGNANVTNLGELVGFEGKSYTGDMDDNGNWTNFYYQNGTWNMASVDVSAAIPTFVSTPGIDNGVGNSSHHDWVYNAVCDKFYTMEAGGTRILEADHKASPPTVKVLQTYSGIANGAYGAAWADNEGALYFSNNGTGQIYKAVMDGNCSPTSISVVTTGSATSNNDGMSCPYAPGIEFGGTDTDGDGITDEAELLDGTNPVDGCDPFYNGPTCNGVITYSFIGIGNPSKEIAYINVVNNCDAPENTTTVYNDNIDNDYDDDGVPNADDPDPLDPNKTFTQYIPSANTYGTYAFEDLWPEQGDYDFNDFVVQVREEIITNSSGNQIFEVVFDLKIMAMGGEFNNNFGITIPDASNAGQVTVYSPENTTHEVSQRGNSKVVIIKHPKALFFSNDIINADLSAPYFEPIEIQVKIELDGSTVYPGGYNTTFFIEQHGISGHEIHMPSVPPTSNMNISLFGTIHDDTNPGSGKYFMTPTNLPWGLYVPTEWQYPLEGEPILDAYMDFDDYAQGNPSLPWYQSNGGNVNNAKIYTGH